MKVEWGKTYIIDYGKEGEKEIVCGLTGDMHYFDKELQKQGIEKPETVELRKADYKKPSDRIEEVK